MDEVRQRIEGLMRERGDDCLAISRLLGRNAAYFQQYLRRGTPKKLGEDDRRVLARYFGVDESDLGGPPRPASSTVMVPRLELGASAGPGAIAGREDADGSIGFESRWLRRLTATPDKLSIIQVSGDSMAPTLNDGDDILVDNGDGADRLREGIYVMRKDDVLWVKRVLRGAGKAFSIVSDNPAYPAWTDVDPGSLAIIGRVIWAGRKIG